MAVRGAQPVVESAEAVATQRDRGTALRRGTTEAIRRKIVFATSSLLDRLDYRSITIDEIALAAGVSRSTIHRHWSSRELLLLEAYTHRTSGLVAVPDTGDVTEDLRTYLGQLAFCLHFAGAASTASGLIADALRDAQFGVVFRQTMRRGRRDALLTMLVRGQRRGQIRTDLELDVALDAIEGALHHRMSVSRQAIDGPFMRSLVDVTLCGLRTDVRASAACATSSD